MPAHRDTETTQQIPTLNITFSPLYSTRNPFSTCKCLTIRTSSVPAALPVRYRGLGLTLDLPLHFTPICLPSTILGPGLNLGFCNVSTSAQSSYLLTRLLPSTRRVVLPGGTEIPDEPQMLCTEPVSPNQPREQVHHSNAKARREFISSALGPKSHPAQWNLTRTPNKGVWWLIYRQFFVSVTGVSGVT